MATITFNNNPDNKAGKICCFIIAVIIILLSVLSLASCGPDSYSSNWHGNDTTAVDTTGVQEYVESVYKVYEFKYKDHDYIMFQQSARPFRMGVVHNPECRECLKMFD